MKPRGLRADTPEVSGLADRIRRLPARLLLPYVVADGDVPDRLTLIGNEPIRPLLRTSSLTRPGLSLCLLADRAGAVHCVPIVDDGELPRAARPGDEAGIAIAAHLIAGEPTRPFERQRSISPVDLARVGLNTAQSRELASALISAGAGGPTSGAGEQSGELSERVQSSDAQRERISVADALVVTIERLPRVLAQRPIDVIAHVRCHDYGFAAADLGDMYFEAADELELGHWFGPVVRLTGRTSSATTVHDALLGAVIDSVRGDEADSSIALATAMGFFLGRWHIALGSSSAVAPVPIELAGQDLVMSWRRAAADAVGAASVLGESGSVARLRGGRVRVRTAFEALEGAAGTAVLLGDCLPGLSGLLLERDGQVRLAPDEVFPAEPGHCPAQDVAVLLRGIGHVAWATHRRLVVAGEPVSVEQIADWENGMRELLVAAYVQVLRAAGRRELFDDALVTAFEIQDECEHVVRSVRTLSAGSMVFDTALAALLGR